MTAESNSKHGSDTAAAAGEQQDFIYNNPNTPREDDPGYVPEREFVLMPLFRRIGEMLGIGRRTEDEEHIYVPEPAVPRVTEPEHQHWSAEHVQTAEEHDLAPSSAMHSEAEGPAQPNFDVLGMEQEAEPELVSVEQPEPVGAAMDEPEPEPIINVPEFSAEPEPSIAYYEPVESEPAMVTHAAEESLPAPIIPREEDRTAPIIQPVAAMESRPQPAPARPGLTQDDIAQLIAPIAEAAREAAARISTAISQAAEWLHTKEEEIRHRAQLAVESKQADISQASSTSAPSWESDPAPGLQREAAWHETGGIPVARKKDARPEERKPVVPKAKRPPLWKQVDWAKEFTPKRVALLGGVAMAMLMVVGVSLARRPASSVLPQQQQTRSIQPGGVTLTTHPRTTTAAIPATTPAARQTNPAPQKPSVAPTRNARSAAYDDGPDVVTHYYNKQKPSPVHQSTVAGVKHYSDMESR